MLSASHVLLTCSLHLVQLILIDLNITAAMDIPRSPACCGNTSRTGRAGVSCPGKLTQVMDARKLDSWVICCHNVSKSNKGHCKECSLHLSSSVISFEQTNYCKPGRGATTQRKLLLVPHTTTVGGDEAALWAVLAGPCP